MSRDGWAHGEALTPDKKGWRYFSPSTLMSADPTTSEGCLRKLFYEKVLQLKGPEQKWQTDGKILHAQNEDYLLTGHKNMESLALSGLFMLPKPKTVDPRIEIEHDITGGSLETAPLHAAGVPIAGLIDCVHWQGTNAGTTDIMEAIDPPGTVEVIDWKTTSDPKWIKTAQEMARTLQMTTYGKWALVAKKADRVRLSHGYYITKGRHTPRKVSLLVHKDQIDERWEYVEHLASSLIEAVKETNVDNVPANTRACDAFRGCPHRGYCKAAQHNSLSSLIGSDFATTLLADSVLFIPTSEELSKEPSMSLLDRLKATAPAASIATPNLNVQSEMQRLALEEVNAKYPGIGATLDALEKVGLGMPKFEGELARVYSIVRGTSAPAEGNGELKECSFAEPEQLAKVLEEAQAIVASRGGTTTTVVSPFPEDAPPALASPAVKEEPAPEPILTAEDAMAVAAGEKPKKRGPKPKVKVEEVAEAAPTLQTTIEEVVKDVLETPATTTTAINLFVDCVPSVAYQSLWPLINRLTDIMAQQHNAVDYRSADDKSPLGYSKWKGWLAHGLRNTPIPPGNYVLDNSMTDTGAVVVEAMRDIVAKSGGLFVRGTR